MLMRGAAVIAVAAGACLMGAVSSSGAPARRCDIAGKTLLENGQARVFRAGRITYACELGGSPRYRLRDPANHTASSSLSPTQIRLTGRYVSWVEENWEGPGKLLDVRDLKGGPLHRVLVPGVHGGAGLEGYVVNRHGTLVIIDSEESDGCRCRDDYIVENDQRSAPDSRNVYEDAATTFGNGSPPQSPIEPNSLALSVSGTTVFWIERGQPKSHTIP